MVTISPQTQGEIITQSTIAAIAQTIATQIKPQQILLFGSYATGTPTEDSDLDLLIVMETDRPKNKRSTPIRLIFCPVPCSMDILVFTPEEIAYWNGTTNHIITNAFLTGKLLYDGSAS
jgi:hypothetical protein